MKKLRLMAVRSQRDEILRCLMLLNCVEISEPAPSPEDELLRSLQPSGEEEVNRRRKDQALLLNAIRILDRFIPEKRGLLTPLPQVGMEELLDEKALEEDFQVARRLQELDEELRDLASRASRELAELDALQPWQWLEMPLEYTGTPGCSVTLGTMPGRLELEDLKKTLAGAVEEAELICVSQEGESSFLLLFASRDRTEDALEALRPLGFSPVNLSGYRGTPEENISAIMDRLEGLEKDKGQIVQRIVQETVHRRALQLGADTLETCIAREEAGRRFLNTENVFYLEGWITAPEEEKLRQALDPFCCAWETEDPDPEHPEEVPIQLRNNRLTRPYSVVTGMYSLPAYNGLDPNPFVAPFFALFFGIMFADMAYGLILLAAGTLILRKARPRGGLKDMAGLMVECGITTFILGFLTGGFFGDAVSVLGSMFGKEWTPVPTFGAIRLGDVVITLPMNLLEGNNPLYMLIISIGLGAVHLALGVGIGMYLKIREGQWVDAVLNDLSWWVILVGLGLLFLDKGPAVLYVGVAMMVLGAVLGGRGFGRITGIFSAVYNGATGYLGDLLSYSRLMALMLAGSVIASVFNQLGALGGGTVGGVILFIVVFCIGHILNFALNLIGCFVHTMRLQLLEFFGKWYRDGGRPFRPLNVQTKYVDIKED